MIHKLSLIPVFLVMSLFIRAQGFIGLDKDQVRKKLEKAQKKLDSVHVRIMETDSTTVYSFRDENYSPTDFIYYFDAQGKCRSEKLVASCDSCFQKYLTATLGNKEYKWKKLNGNQYISDFQSRLLLELHTDKGNFTYRILRTSWSKEQYEMIVDGL